MATTLTNVYDIVRLLLNHNDANSVATDFSNADLLIHINNAQRWWFDNTEKRVKAVTLKASFTSGTFITTLDNSAVYPEILEVSLQGAGGANDAIVLAPLPWSEIRSRQNSDPTTGQPTHYAVKKASALNPAAATQNRWSMVTYPVPDTTYVVNGIVRDYPTALTTGTDTLYVGDFEGRVCIPVLSAIYAAEGAARPDLAEDLAKLLPRMIQDRLAAHSSHEEMLA